MSNTKRSRLRVLWLAVMLTAAYAGLYLFARFGASGAECLTDTWCVSTTKGAAMLAAVRLGLVVAIGIVLSLTFSFTRYLGRTGRLFAFAGGLMLLLGIGGILLLLSVTASGRLTEFLHIIIVGGVLAALGGWMLLRGLRRKRD